MDWDRRVLDVLAAGGAGYGCDIVPWEAVRDLFQGLEANAAADLSRTLLSMLDLDYRNVHSAPMDSELLPLPAGMRPDDLLCLEAAAYVAADLALPGAGARLQALLREPRFHAVYPHLRRLHLDLPDLLRRCPS